MNGVKAIYSEAELELVRKNKELSTQKIYELLCKKFNRTDITAGAVKLLRQRKGWNKPSNRGFQKGNTYGSQVKNRSNNRGFFKKGHKAFNEVPLGSERSIKTGNILVKTTGKVKWQQKSRILYVQHYGPLKPTDRVRFLDGNPANCEPENLIKVSDSEHSSLNRVRYNQTPAELKPTAMLMAQVMAKVAQHTKKA